MTARIIPIPSKRIKDLTGNTYGRLYVLGFAGVNPHGQADWVCECSCGNSKVITGGRMATGNTASCGCLHTETITSHGMVGTKTYRAWEGMSRRCRSNNTHTREYYWNRGISVCEEWKTFEIFYADMGEAPKGLTLERIDNDAGYSKANCKWATWADQALNKRTFKNNTSGCTGVIWAARDTIWRASISKGRKTIHLGSYTQWWDAVCARKSAENRYWL